MTVYAVFEWSDDNNCDRLVDLFFTEEEANKCYLAVRERGRGAVIEEIEVKDAFTGDVSSY